VLPEVATLDESGVPGYDMGNWYGFVLPAGTPPELVRRIHTDLVKALTLPDVREKLTAMGAAVVANKPDDFGAFIKAESAKWAKLIAEAGITAQ
jgi:tripartite-type tricarboxylate transporter receptor subunit TctC